MRAYSRAYRQAALLQEVRSLRKKIKDLQDLLTLEQERSAEDAPLPGDELPRVVPVMARGTYSVPYRRLSADLQAHCMVSLEHLNGVIARVLQFVNMVPASEASIKSHRRFMLENGERARQATLHMAETQPHSLRADAGKDSRRGL